MFTTSLHGKHITASAITIRKERTDKHKVQVLCFYLENRKVTIYCSREGHALWTNLKEYEEKQTSQQGIQIQLCGMCDQQSLRSAWAYPQSDQRLC